MASKVLDRTVEGAISDEQWEDIVIRLRQYAGKAGVSSVQGTTREWTADWDTGTITLTASTRNGQTRFRLLGDASGAGVLAYIFGPIVGLFITIALCSWVGKAGLGAMAVAGTLLFLSTLCFFLTRAWAKTWQTKSQRSFAKVFKDIVESVEKPGLKIPATGVLLEADVANKQEIGEGA